MPLTKTALISAVSSENQEYNIVTVMNMHCRCYWKWKKSKENSCFWKGNNECMSMYKWCEISRHENWRSHLVSSAFLEERLSAGTASVCWIPQTWLSVLSKHRTIWKCKGKFTYWQQTNSDKKNEIWHLLIISEH